IWWDRPQRGLVMRPMDALLLPFSLFWVSIPSIALMSGLRHGGAGPFLFVPLLFVAIGLYFLFCVVFLGASPRARAVYGLTISRVLIIQPSKYKSLDLAGISEINLQLRRSGRGSIVFGPEYDVFVRRSNNVWAARPRCRHSNRSTKLPRSM